MALFGSCCISFTLDPLAFERVPPRLHNVNAPEIVYRFRNHVDTTYRTKSKIFNLSSIRHSWSKWSRKPKTHSKCSIAEIEIVTHCFRRANGRLKIHRLFMVARLSQGCSCSLWCIAVCKSTLCNLSIDIVPPRGLSPSLVILSFCRLPSLADQHCTTRQW